MTDFNGYFVRFWSLELCFSVYFHDPVTGYHHWRLKMQLLSRPGSYEDFFFLKGTATPTLKTLKAMVYLVGRVKKPDGWKIVTEYQDWLWQLLCTVLQSWVVLFSLLSWPGHGLPSLEIEDAASFWAWQLWKPFFFLKGQLCRLWRLWRLWRVWLEDWKSERGENLWNDRKAKEWKIFSFFSCIFCWRDAKVGG